MTRALLLEVAPAAGIKCVENDLPIEALGDAEEAFLTSTTRDVQAISAVDGRGLARVRGPSTQQLANAFRDLVAGNPDP